MTSTLRCVVHYDILGLEESFNGSCFGHVFSCQYGTVKESFAKTWDLCQLKMHNLTFKIALFGWKGLVRTNKVEQGMYGCYNLS